MRLNHNPLTDNRKDMSNKKVKLIVKTDSPWHPEGRCIKGISYALPYYLSRQGKYFHRVRSANNHWHDGNLSHTAVGFWCGNSGFIGDKGKLYAKVPEGGVLCATCEGRAIGAGLAGERTINGKKVMYSPTKQVTA